MQITIFYSWQSDLSNATNRSFIQTALEQAARQIHKDESVKVEPVIDRDTKGMTGSPDIGAAIFGKIDTCHIFVCDVSIINSTANARQTPNPNVLVELGYAVKTLGWERVIMVMNTEFGGPEKLPFDLSKKRVMAYKASADDENRADSRKVLAKGLEEAVRAIATQIDEIASIPQTNITVTEAAIRAVEENRPDQAARIREYVSWLALQIQQRWPSQGDDAKLQNRFKIVVENSIDLLADFARFSKVISENALAGAAQILYDEFGQLIELYNLPRGNHGSSDPRRFDFAKFMGHELFVIFISQLVRDERWSSVAQILARDIHVSNVFLNPDHTVNYWYISQEIAIIRGLAERSIEDALEIHGDLIKQLHSSPPLSALVSLGQFTEGDFFLALRSVVEDGVDHNKVLWRPWSVAHVANQPPRYLVQARYISYAVELAAGLGIRDVEFLRERFQAAKDVVRKTIFNRYFDDVGPIEDVNAQALASK